MNYQMLHVRQPNIVSSIWLEMKPPSVNELTVHLHNNAKKLMFLKSQHGLVIQSHEQYSANKRQFMSIKIMHKKILMLENSKSRWKRINMFS